MLKNRLAPYILISVLIHTGLLFGVHSFLNLPDAQLEPPVLIPVEMVVHRKQPIAPEVTITASEPIDEKKQDSITQSQLAVAMDAAQGSDDIADPIPVENNYQSSLNLEANRPSQMMRMARKRNKSVRYPEITLSRTPPLHLLPADEQIFEVLPRPEKGDSSPRLTSGTMPTLIVSPTIPKGNEVASEQVALANQEAPLHLAAVEPSFPIGSLPSDMSISVDLAEAAAALSPHYLPKGDEVASEPVELANQESPLYLAAVEPSFSTGSSPSDMSISVDLTEAAAALSPHYLSKGDEAAIEAVELAIQETPLHLAAVEPMSPARPTALDISVSGDLVEAKASVRSHYLQRGDEVASKMVDLVIQETSLRLATVEPSPPVGIPSSDVSASIDLKETNVAASPQFFLVSHKALSSLVDVQARDDFIAELRPLPQPVEGEPRLMASILQVKSHPAGAQVYVDGLLSGDTPLDMELTLGKHEVRLALPGHYDWKAQIKLTENNKSRPISFRLLPIE